MKILFLVFSILGIGLSVQFFVLDRAFKMHFFSGETLKVSANIFLNMENTACNDSVTGAIKFDIVSRIYALCSQNKWLSVDACVTMLGSVCQDGTYFAGFSPEDGMPLFTGVKTIEETWNDGNAGSYNLMQATSLQDGRSNTEKLTKSASNGAIHKAARYCHALSEFGHNDWYLPARNELAVIEAAQIVIDSKTGQKNNRTGYFWSSTEAAKDAAWFHHGGTLGWDTSGKDRKFSVLCVRR